MFSSGDNPAWSSPEYVDSDWDSLNINVVWDEQGYADLNGFGWYRISFLLPENLKKSSYLKDSLQFNLGRIDDYDQVFLNGRLIGTNGRTLAEGIPLTDDFIDESSAWYKPRKYILSANDPRINWGSTNHLAVRVFDSGGLGGMYGGSIGIRMTGVSDYVHFESAGPAIDMKEASCTIDIRGWNRSNVNTFKGSISIRAARESDGKEVYQEKRQVVFAPGQEEYFRVASPLTDESVCVRVEFKEDKTGELLSFTSYLPYICTPAPVDAPRINGPQVVGHRPGKPFLFLIPVSGKRPISFRAEGIPPGLALDGNSGIISGTAVRSGDHSVMLIATNEAGSDSSRLLIRIGDAISLTPPMGWNSWNCWGLAVDQEKTIAAARSFREHGLADHGWTYINIDDGWEIPWDDPRDKRDGKGNILPNEKFPDMKALGDSIHALGLKFGIYSSPGPYTCGGYTASYGYEKNDAASLASWGIDYLKYDWCSYGQIAADRTLPELKKPYLVMKECLENVNRDIVYSLCQYGMGDVWEWGASVGGNLWRTTGDITDTWESLSEIGFSQVDNAPFAGPGHWNDPDMLVLGWVGWGPRLHYTRLTPSEQYTHMSLWCLLSAPLLLGCDLEKLDPFTLNLITNDEVIAIDQDPLGKQAIPVLIDGEVQVWMKDLADGSRAMGIFNLSDGPVNYELWFRDAGLEGEFSLRDIWRQKDLGKFETSYKTGLPAHGVILLKIS